MTDPQVGVLMMCMFIVTIFLGFPIAFNPCYKPPAAKRGPLAELADAVDSKSTALRGIPVRFRGGPPAGDGPEAAGRSIQRPLAARSVASPEDPRETGGSR